jgi:hypothetical protein
MMQDKPGLRALKVWPRRNGKDLTDINILAAKALQRKGLYFYVAPFQNQIRSIIWEGMDGTGKKFLDYIPPELVTRKLNQTMKLWLKNGSAIQLLGSDNPDAVVGNNPLGIVFTEFSLHKPGIWEYLRPILAENGGWAMFNGTPRGMNHFYLMARMAEKNPAWFYQYLTQKDTGYPTLEAIQEERDAGMPESLVDQEFFSSWTASSEETLIPLDFIKPCIDTRLFTEDYIHAPKILSCDPAYAEKGDQAVIARRQGRMLYPLDKWRGIKNTTLASHVAKYIVDWRPDAVFIDAGRGEGVIHRLEQLGFSNYITPIHFGGAVYSDLYRKKKDEMWDRTKLWLCTPGSAPQIPDDEELIRDLSAPTFHINDKGYLEVEGKKSLKARGYSSTDSADAVILTFAEENIQISPVNRLSMTPAQRALASKLLQSGDQLDHSLASRPYDPLTYMVENDHQRTH